MTGSLQIKNEKYYMVLNSYDANGKRKQKWIGTGLAVKGNKTKAQRLLRETLAQQEAQSVKPCRDMLFADAVHAWLQAVAPQVDAVTLQGYQITAKKHIIPYFEQRGALLTEVTHQLLQTYLDEKFACGRLDGRGGLAPASLRQHKNVLFQTLSLAVENEWIPANPCERVRLPQKSAPKASFYNAQQIQDLLQAARDEPLYPVLVLTVFYGLRRSEVLGLQWDSINLEDNTFVVRHTVVKVSELVEKDKTKNAASRRTYPITPEIKQLLLAAKTREKENRKVFGAAYHANNYVCKWPDGRPFSPDYVSHAFSRLLKKNGLPHIRFHDLRHSCASNLIAMGYTLKDVQEWLGHSDIKTTANIYTHLEPGRKKVIASEMGARLELGQAQTPC